MKLTAHMLNTIFSFLIAISLSPTQQNRNQHASCYLLKNAGQVDMP